MKLSLLLIAMIAVISFSSFKGEKSEENNNAAAVTSINGSIVDENSGELLVGVEVILEGTDQKTYSDFDGNFVFENVVSGAYSITAKIVSYEDVKADDVNVSIEKNKPVKLEMKQVN